MRSRSFICITVASLCSTVNADAAVQKVTEGVYAGIGDNAILLLLATQLGQVVWYMGKWIVDKYFREQKDKDAEVKKLKAEFHEFREEMARGFAHIQNEMKHIQKMPSEKEVLNQLSERMEFMVFKAVRDLGLKDGKR